MQLATFTKGLDKVSEWSGRIFMWLIIPLTLVVVYEVVSTKFFDTPHIWAPEITAYLYGPYFMLVAAYTLLYNAHVRIDIIYRNSLLEPGAFWTVLPTWSFFSLS
jgi:TRAP-type mannitol/chloroaromatic compound transport system permease small subunit